MSNQSFSTELVNYLKELKADDILTPALTGKIHLVDFPAGKLVMPASEPISYIYILVKGTLRVFSINENGKMGTIAYSTPPQMLGDIEYIQGANSLHNVVAETSSRLIRISISDVQKYLSGNIAFYRLICRNLISKLYKTSDDYSKSLLYNAKARLAQCLLNWTVETDCIKFNSSSTAETLGITQRHISRIISELVQENAISRECQKKIKIINRQYLKAIAEN